ncbi:MAG TPA: cytochrome P450 [Solirubrobacteraceae bacterium]|nr:cytochrome P450 [Solirubrobacteraceae bacterium]
MTALAENQVAAEAPAPAAAIGAPASPAGPVDSGAGIAMPPAMAIPGVLQGLRFARRPMTFALGAQREFGDVWQIRVPTRAEAFVVTCHPDHLRSLLKADPAEAPSLTGESPLRPILGPNSVLTSVGARHLRQRKLLLPPFHGEAVQRYVEMIADVARQEIDHWPLDEPFALAPRMQAVTLEVIMRGVFGVGVASQTTTAERRMRQALRRMLAASMSPLYFLVELRNARHLEPKGLLAAVMAMVDRQMYAVIRERRAAGDSDERGDVLSLLLEARDEHGEPLTDPELRDELMSLVLAGHETTANSLAWIFERLLRTPAAYGRLREVVRGDDRPAAQAYVEATIHEGMRIRPVIPMIGRLVMRPWRLGEYTVPARTPIGVSIIALHHRPDVYADPHAFLPERFLSVKPGTYTWIPFGGGIRRCLGASLAMAEQRVVLEAIARRTDLVAPEPTSERPRMRNVTMIPRSGCLVRVARRHPD